MRDVTEAERRLCSLQGRVFEASLEFSEAGSAVFVRRFMNSDLARRLDAGGAVLETATVGHMVREVDGQYGGTGYGSARFSAGELHWMGYLYRYLCCATGLSSKAAYRVLGARELRALYGPYHALDPAQAVAELAVAKGISPYDDIEHGVRVLARIRGVAI
ncbi:MAG: hypothetical protein IJ087_05010 [Eggerthellaceae bacterium]|nr:hypothetical protein [Eggerthellaceae bacterium]